MNSNVLENFAWGIYPLPVAIKTDLIICKYWKSSVFSSIPDVSPVREGIMELTIKNNSNRWMEISKGVFSAYGMKLYYDSSLVYLNASMKIINKSTAETYFINAPYRKNMLTGKELFNNKRGYFGSNNSFVMEKGF